MLVMSAPPILVPTARYESTPPYKSVASPTAESESRFSAAGGSPGEKAPIGLVKQLRGMTNAPHNIAQVPQVIVWFNTRGLSKVSGCHVAQTYTPLGAMPD